MTKKVNPKSYVTEGSLKNALSDVVELILEGMDKLFNELKGDINGLKGEIGGMKREIGGMKREMKTGFTRVDTDLTDIKRQINDLKVDTPTQKEFNELKVKVDKYIST